MKKNNGDPINLYKEKILLEDKQKYNMEFNNCYNQTFNKRYNTTNDKYIKNGKYSWDNTFKYRDFTNWKNKQINSKSSNFLNRTYLKSTKYSSKKKKFRWHDGYGRELTAGGLLPYDENGIWVIGEKNKNGKVEWTDPGGKYKYEDCDIYTTISREFSEELYYSTVLSRFAILNIAKTHGPIYVNGHENKPVYICYPVNANILKIYGVNLSPNAFKYHREIAVNGNPNVPESYYNSIVLKHIPYFKLTQPKILYNMSYRLKSILRSAGVI